MILSNILWAATSSSTVGSEKLPEIAKILAPVVRVALDWLRSDDEFLLNCSTILVAVGVLLEVFEIVYELREKTAPFRFHRPEMPKWMVWAGFAGWLMIVVGVTGELVFEGAVSTRSEELESISDRLLGDAQVAAAEAQQKANDAARQAGLLGVKVDTLPNFVAQREGEINSELSQFKKYEKGVRSETSTALDRLKTDTAELNKATEDAKIAAKQAESERVAMAEANAPRYLNGQQQVDFVSTLKGMGKLNVQLVQPPSTTPDAGPLASLLEALMKQANWNESIMVPLGGWAKFVQVCPGPTPQPNVSTAATAIVNALNQAKIPAFVKPNCDPKAPQYGAGTPIKNADIIIYVGSKF